MRILMLVAAITFSPALVRAQGVPLISVDLTRGDGRHTLQTPHEGSPNRSLARQRPQLFVHSLLRGGIDAAAAGRGFVFPEVDGNRLRHE